MRTTLSALVLALVMTAGQADAAVIGFGGLAAPGPFTTYAEAGFTVTPTAGNWLAFTTFGHPAPFIEFTRELLEPAITATVEVTAAAAPFLFSSVDLYSSITTIPYVITGLRNGTPVFALAAIVPNTFGSFVTVTSSSVQLIDTLRITLSNPVVPVGGNPVGLDNIVVNPVPVPEPASLLLLGGGAFALAGRRRLWRRSGG